MAPPWFRILNWVVTLAAIFVYIYMVTVTLPHLAEMAGGMPVFDLRFGYDFETARTILTNLGEDGRNDYASVQHVWDSFYPPLLALSLAFWIWLAAPRWRNAGLPLPVLVLGLLIGICFLGAAFDLAENAMVGQMLDLGPGGITPEIVSTASALTLGKAVSSTIAMTALLVLGVGPFFSSLGKR